MEMLRSFRGDKHEFCLTVIKLKHVRSCIYIYICSAHISVYVLCICMCIDAYA